MTNIVSDLDAWKKKQEEEAARLAEIRVTHQDDKPVTTTTPTSTAVPGSQVTTPKVDVTGQPPAPQTFGHLGGYDPHRNWDSNLAKLGAHLTKHPQAGQGDSVLNPRQPQQQPTGFKRMAWDDAKTDPRFGIRTTDLREATYGSRMGPQSPDSVFSADFVDQDGDGIDDRHQPGPGQQPGQPQQQPQGSELDYYRDGAQKLNDLLFQLQQSDPQLAERLEELTQRQQQPQQQPSPMPNWVQQANPGMSSATAQRVLVNPATGEEWTAPDYSYSVQPGLSNMANTMLTNPETGEMVVSDPNPSMPAYEPPNPATGGFSNPGLAGLAPAIQGAPTQDAISNSFYGAQDQAQVTPVPGSGFETIANPYGKAEEKAEISTPGYSGYQKTDLPVGFTADYLKDLAASQIDPLSEGYQEALRLAGADYNRLGMRGSGFELGSKYGSQPDSITSRYLQEVGNVHRDVALRGAEATREDTYRKQQMDDFNRAQWANFDLSAEQQNFMNQMGLGDARMSVAQVNEIARQHWAGFQLSADQQNFLNQMGLWDAGMQMANMDEMIRRYNVDEDFRRQVADKDWLKSMIDTGTVIDQYNKSNQQWWANFQQNQAQQDYQNVYGQWKDRVGLEQYGIDRQTDLDKWRSQMELSVSQMNQEQKMNALESLTNLLGTITGWQFQAAQVGMNATTQGQQAYEQSQKLWSDTFTLVRGLGDK